MASVDYLVFKNKAGAQKSVNVVDLRNKIKSEEKQYKKRNIIITIITLITLVIFGFVISL